ncbi:MAG TPA: antibiotic biosynthesis monooxygenase [Parachlamydiaceae bacterium]|nr:antibiotic biosynthesis monooxygenase [Parachlamydiaceae bacterium]
MTQFVEKPTIITLKIEVKSEKLPSFANWQARMNAMITAQPGFISLEFLSPPEKNQDWMIVQRFADLQKSSIWRKSSIYQGLLDELKNIAVTGRAKEISSDESSVNNGVTEVIVAEVFPEKEREYRDWIAKIHLFEANYPGFRGVYVQSPVESKGKFWITLLQFDTMHHLDSWLASSDRHKLLEESKSMISYLETHRVISPYAGWFASIARVGEIPAVWKQTMIILLVLFPIVMLEFKFLNPLTQGLNISLGTFIGNAISVSLISFPAMPIAIYFLGWWLSPGPRNRTFMVLGGTLLMFGLYLLEIWLFWSFV